MKSLNLVFSICFLFIFDNSIAQVPGCKDPMAINYNHYATINDGTCIYTPEAILPTTSYNLNGTVSETSGLIYWKDRIWTINDNTDTNLYPFDTINGTGAEQVPLPNVVNTDWEEISQDDVYIYIGDFGNNKNGNRTNLKILRIDKNSVQNNSPIIDTINFSYSDQTDFSPSGSNNTNFDCESFIVSKDSIYLYTKEWISKKTRVYSLSKIPGTYIANYKSTFDTQGLITGAVYLESKKIIVLCGYSIFLQPFVYLLYDFTDADFFNGNKRKITLSLPFYQVEGIASSNGLKYYFSNEYFKKSTADIPPQLHTLDLSPYLSNYLNISTGGGGSTFVSENDLQQIVSVFPIPSTDSIHLKTDASLVNESYSLVNSSGQVVLTGKVKSEESIIDISNLSPGMYILKIANQSHKVIKK